MLFRSYYTKAQDYSIVSNAQHYISGLLSKKQWDYSAISSLALLSMPLEKKAFLKNINVLSPGSTLKIKRNQFIVGNRDLNFLSEEKADTDKYLFNLKKAFELQLNAGDFMSIPFENSYSARFAFSIWCNKAKKTWGFYHLHKSDLYPEKFLDQLILGNLKIFNIPQFTDSDEVFKLFKEYVLFTGLSDFPDIFNLAGKFKKDEDINEINLLTNYAEWFFEKDPLKRSEKLLRIVREKKINDFKKNFVMENNFFRKEFYPFLIKGIEQHFAENANKLVVTDSLYDDYHFLVNQYFVNTCSASLGWMNSFRTFYSPGMFYSLSCQHIQQRLINKKISVLTSELHKSFADETKLYPKPKEKKYILPEYPNLNLVYFPLIANQIGLLIEKSEKIPYYDFSKLLKIFKKAKKQNIKAINTILKWTAFEVCRGFIE